MAQMVLTVDASASLGITGLNMPDLDAIGPIRSARANPACQGIPVPHADGRIPGSRELAGRAAGAAARIAKPFGTPQLMAVVK